MNDLHTHWQAVIEWSMIHPFATIQLKLQNGIPMAILTPTEDGLGVEHVKIEILTRRMLKDTYDKVSR